MGGEGSAVAITQRVRLGSLLIDECTFDEASNRIIALANRNQLAAAVVVTPNMHHVAMAESNSRFRAACASAALVLPDGWPVVAAMRLLDGQQTGRVTGSDLAPQVLAEAAAGKLRIGIVGGRQGAAEQVAEKLTAQFPDAQVLLTAAPMFSADVDAADVARLVDLVKPTDLDVLLLCTGAPKSEILAAAAAPMINARVILCFGAAIDFMAGSQKRAPQWIRSIGFEWAYRVAQEPKRLAGRYLTSAPVFARVLAKQLLSDRRAKSS